jgi:AhpD family alkylhydroperoxidase
MSLDSKTRELVAIGASIGCNCITCLEWHYKKCIELGIPKQTIKEAVDMAKKVKEAPKNKIFETADRLLNN